MKKLLILAGLVASLPSLAQNYSSAPAGANPHAAGSAANPHAAAGANPHAAAGAVNPHAAAGANPHAGMNPHTGMRPSGTTNKDWWPNQLNVSMLRQNSEK